MPQKKNPDVAELVRGKAGRVFANLIGTFDGFKGIALSYNRDLQEDKHFVFDSADTVVSSLKTMTGFISSLKFKREKMESKRPMKI
jgi:argininosuccinate lyase